MSKGGIIDIGDDQKPLCPMIGYPSNIHHENKNRILNAFYDAAEKNEDGEFAEEKTENAYYAAAYGNKISDRMDLYWASVVTPQVPPQTTIIAYWFKCNTCGFVLPATTSYKTG